MLLFLRNNSLSAQNYKLKSPLRVCSSDKEIFYFIRHSKVWSILHHGSVWLVHKQCYLILLCIFLVFFLFFITKFVFLPFSCLLLIKVPNFHHRILTNQKHELVVSNCQRNCMLIRISFVKDDKTLLLASHIVGLEGNRQTESPLFTNVSS